MWPNPQETEEILNKKFIEETLNEKPRFLCSETVS